MASLSVVFNPPLARVISTAPKGAVIASVMARWSDGHPYTGRLTMATNPAFALSLGEFVIVKNAAALKRREGTTQQVSVTATARG